MFSPAPEIKICTEDMVARLAPFATAAYFLEAYQEQVDGKRLIFVAVCGAEIAGYVHLNFLPLYAPFRRLGIPEVQDLYVVPEYRRGGVGEALVRACEHYAASMGKTDIGIGVGVTGDFGAAQRLYARMGYLPDGAGVVFERQGVTTGEVKPIDERLCLMLLKPVSESL